MKISSRFTPGISDAYLDRQESNLDVLHDAGDRPTVSFYPPTTLEAAKQGDLPLRPIRAEVTALEYGDTRDLVWVFLANRVVMLRESDDTSLHQRILDASHNVLALGSMHGLSVLGEENNRF